MENLNLKYYKEAEKYLDNFTEKDEENYLKIAKIPYQSSYTLSLRKVAGNSTYFCKNEKDYKIVGKCITFLKNKPIQFVGIPLPKELNIDNVINGIPIIYETLKSLNYENCKWILSSRELSILNKYYNGNIPYNLEYYDSDYYDDIKIALDSIPEKIKKTYKEECMYIAELFPTQIENLVPEFIEDLKAKHGKDFYRAGFYNKLIKNHNKYNYKFIGLFCNSQLVAVEAIWIKGNIARSDLGLHKKDNNWYRERKLSTKINRYGFTIFKVGLYKYLLAKCVDIYSADGVGYNVGDTKGLRALKEKDYNNKMDRFIITLKE